MERGGTEWWGTTCIDRRVLQGGCRLLQGLPAPSCVHASRKGNSVFQLSICDRGTDAAKPPCAHQLLQLGQEVGVCGGHRLRWSAASRGADQFRDSGADQVSDSRPKPPTGQGQSRPNAQLGITLGLPVVPLVNMKEARSSLRTVTSTRRLGETKRKRPKRGPPPKMALGFKCTQHQPHRCHSRCWAPQP